MVPHAVVTVSLATAILPRLSARAAESDLAGVRRNLASMLRTALVVIVPFAMLLPLVARDLANIVYGWGAASEAYPDYVMPLTLFGVALVFFTVHFLMLRGFYSLERTRTVFWIQCVIAATNIALALLVTRSLAGPTSRPASSPPTSARTPSAPPSPTWCSAGRSGGWRPPAWLRSWAGCWSRPRWRPGSPGRRAPGWTWPGPTTRARCASWWGSPWWALVDVAAFVGLARLLRIDEVTVDGRHGHVAARPGPRRLACSLRNEAGRAQRGGT